MDDLEPLESALWLSAIGEIAGEAIELKDAEVERLLRRAYHLLQLSPRSLRPTTRPIPSESQFEQLLECKSFESAAIGLLADSAIYGISKSDARLFEVHISLPGHPDPTIFQSNHLASGVLGAWLKCLMSIEEHLFKPQTEVLRPTQSKAQSASHLRLIER